MSKAIAGLVTTLALGGHAARAQDLEAIGRRLDSLRGASAAVRAELNDYRRAHPATFRFADTMRIANGRMVLYFNDSVAGPARAGIQQADQILRQLGPAQEKIPPLIFSIVPDTAFGPFDASADRKGLLNVRVHRPPHLDEPNRNSADPSPSSIASVIVVEATRQMASTLDPQFAKWMDAPLPLDPRLRGVTDWGLVRLDVVSSLSPLGKACVVGDMKSCRIFLGLDLVADPLRVWYDTAGRRRLVVKEHDNARYASRAATDRCEAGDDAACMSVLELMGMGDQPPANAYVRQSMILYALNRGGDGAAGRLVSTSGSVSAALSAAANRPVDDLLAEWQKNVTHHGGSSTNLPFSIALGSIVWIAVCTFLALRSPRWR
jgi:hypothetical protein